MNNETEMVKKVYSGNANYEWNRLMQDAFHRLEYDTTWRFLKQYLPAKGLVLDAGGGPGRYTIELARLGYDVVLLDLVAEHLEIARKEIAKAGVGGGVKDIIEGSITDLSRFSSNSFDTVLCLGGPLSHVHPEPERRRAVLELVRVVKKERAGICVRYRQVWSSSRHAKWLATVVGEWRALSHPDCYR